MYTFLKALWKYSIQHLEATVIFVGPRMGAIPLHLHLTVLVWLVVRFCISSVRTRAALQLPETGALGKQLITRTCPTPVSLGLQPNLQFLCETPGQQLFLQVACISFRFSSGDSEWAICGINDHTLETGGGN